MKNRPNSSSSSSLLKKSGDTAVGNSYMVVICLVGLGISSFSMYAVVILLFGLLPGLIAVIIDQENNRYISKIVLCYNSCGTAPYILKILFSSNPNRDAIEMIIDPNTWMTIYASAALGWFIYWVFPQVATLYSNIYTQIRVKQLEKELTQLADEWGNEIKNHGK